MTRVDRLRDDGWTVCGTCGGSGKVASSCSDQCDYEIACPDCVDGRMEQLPDRHPAPVWLVFQTDIILGIPVRTLISICESEETARHHIEELRSTYGAGLHFQIVGPWPIRISDERRFAIDF